MQTPRLIAAIGALSLLSEGQCRRRPAGKAVLPLTDITVTECDFGTPRNAAQPWFLHNVRGLVLKNVTIAGQVHSTTLSS